MNIDKLCDHAVKRGEIRLPTARENLLSYEPALPTIHRHIQSLDHAVMRLYLFVKYIEPSKPMNKANRDPLYTSSSHQNGQEAVDYWNQFVNWYPHWSTETREWMTQYKRRIRKGEAQDDDNLLPLFHDPTFVLPNYCSAAAIDSMKRAIVNQDAIEARLLNPRKRGFDDDIMSSPCKRARMDPAILNEHRVALVLMHSILEFNCRLFCSSLIVRDSRYVVEFEVADRHQLLIDSMDPRPKYNFTVRVKRLYRLDPQFVPIAIEPIIMCNMQLMLNSLCTMHCDLPLNLFPTDVLPCLRNRPMRITKRIKGQQFSYWQSTNASNHIKVFLDLRWLIYPLIHGHAIPCAPDEQQTCPYKIDRDRSNIISWQTIDGCESLINVLQTNKYYVLNFWDDELQQIARPHLAFATIKQPNDSRYPISKRNKSMDRTWASECQILVNLKYAQIYKNVFKQTMHRVSECLYCLPNDLCLIISLFAQSDV